jgi:hypothetical protein
MADSKKPYGAVKYADPKNGKYPIDTEEHIRAAWSYINMPKNAAKYPLNGVTLSEVKARIKAAMDKLGATTEDSGGRSATRPVERRFTPAVVGLVLAGSAEERAAGVAPRIGGYAAKFNVYSRDLGHFVEQFAPEIWNKSRGDGWPDAICRFNHDDTQLLGTIAGNTLSLGTDRDGLLYDVEPPPSLRHIVEYVERGDVRKSSVAFRKIEDEWGLTSDGATLRTVHEAQLVDVAPVTVPAYADTTAGLRSLADRFDADFEEVRSLAEAHELRRFFSRPSRDGGAPVRKAVHPAVAMAELLKRRADPFDE